MLFQPLSIQPVTVVGMLEQPDAGFVEGAVNVMLSGFNLWKCQALQACFKVLSQYKSEKKMWETNLALQRREDLPSLLKANVSALLGD